MNLLDYALLIIMAIGLVLGYKKGFFGTITKPIKVIASISLTVIISTPILNAWTRPLFTDKVEGWIYESLLENCPEIAGESAKEAMPLFLRLLAEMIKVDLTGLDASASADEIMRTISEQMALPIGNLIAVVVTYVVLFVVFILILTLVIALLDAVFTTGWLGKINKYLGMVLGALITTVICCVLVSIIAGISEGATAGPISQFFRNFNPFSLIMQI